MKNEKIDRMADVVGATGMYSEYGTRDEFEEAVALLYRLADTDSLIEATAIGLHKQSQYGRPRENQGFNSDWYDDMTDFYRNNTRAEARKVVDSVLAYLTGEKA